MRRANLESMGKVWLLVAASLWAAAAENPVEWSLSGTPPKPGSTGVVRLSAKVAPGWTLYGLSQPENGPRPTRIWLPEGQPFALQGEIKAPAAERRFDANFDTEVEKFKGSPVFQLPVESSGAGTLRVSVQYQTCSETLCLPPKTVTLEK